MKRRNFNILAGSTLASTAVLHATEAKAQATADPTLLTTTLTPMGAERAGNADGSIPAWTGGVSAPPEWNVPFDVKMFSDEKPLYTITKANMAQYADMLTEGVKVQIQNWGMAVNVFQTHRTAACPQWVYDNAAKNVTRAKLDAAGGRFGFTGGYGGPPFPIPDTSDPYIAGVQLIWNHLTPWSGISTSTAFSPSFAVINGHAPLLSAGITTNFVYPYYDPTGTPETYQGYYTKFHVIDRTPANVEGQEDLIWHSSNTTIHPDITWTLVNGEARVRKAPNEAYDTPNSGTNGVNNLDENSTFAGSPQKYDWKFIEKKEMLIPYNNNNIIFANWQDVLINNFVNPEYLRWEKHRVWVVEATLHPGEHNVTAKRRFYIDEDTWWAVLGDGYDAEGTLYKVYCTLNRCVPILPGTVDTIVLIFNVVTGDYAWEGSIDYGPYKSQEMAHMFPPAEFDPSSMAANSSF